MSERLRDPLPPLPELQPGDTTTITAGAKLYRIYNRLGAHLTRPDQLRIWGPIPTARFDHHEPPAGMHADPDSVTAATGYYSIDPPTPSAPRPGHLLALDSPIVTAVAEAFQGNRIIACSDRKGLAIIRTMDDIEVLDLSSGWATRAGAGNHLSTGPHPTTKRWARAIHDAYPDLAGMTWVSSVHPPGRALVLNERAADGKGVVASRLHFDRPLSDGMSSALMAAAASVIGYAIV